MTVISPRARLRALVRGPRCIAPVSIFDPLSARMAEELAFPAMMLAGSVASMGVLGAPDMTLLTLTELAGLARRICRVSALPLIVDADHGYGNALNVRRTVEELEGAGVAAITIEDTALPDPYGQAPRLIPLDEAVDKMRAALGARRDPDLLVIGRTGGAGLGDLPDTAARLKAYQDAGCDMVFVRGVETAEELEAVTSGIQVPVFLGTSNPALRDLDRLSRGNVRICLRGHRPYMAALHACWEAMAAQRDGVEAPPGLESGHLDRLIRQTHYDQLARDFLGAAAARRGHAM
ncbi:isocitrate lyase/PEP mutase family protein [Azospirillum endophyticum]